MSHCAYIYTPKLCEDSVRSLVSALRGVGITITHLGKTDPPKRWSGDEDAAVRQILEGTNLTNWTYLRDSRKQLDFSIELHRDAKWEHDTLSLSGPMVEVMEASGSLAKSIEHYLVVVGLLGAGPSQIWQILSLEKGCPERLKQHFKIPKSSV